MTKYCQLDHIHSCDLWLRPFGACVLASFRTASDGKLGGAWERGYLCVLVNKCHQSIKQWYVHSHHTTLSHTPMVLPFISVGCLSRLRQGGYKLRFCTNETQITRRALVEKLQGLGFAIEEEEVYCPAPACRQFISEHNLRPYLLGELQKWQCQVNIIRSDVA